MAIALERADGAISVFRTAVLPEHDATRRYVERLLKFLLWQKGGWRITVAGDPRLAAYLQQVYSPTGARLFRFRIHGRASLREGR